MAVQKKPTAAQVVAPLARLARPQSGAVALAPALRAAPRGAEAS